MIRFISTLLIIVAVLAGPSFAETPQNLKWENLAPPPPDFKDPLQHLEMALQVKLHAIAGIREQARRGWISKVSPTYERAVELTQELKDKGIEVETLLNGLAELDRNIEKHDKTIIPALDGQFVRLPGYVLPLDFNGAEVQDFFLVPYVGACIHVPPPPPNQIVLVHLEKPLKIDDIFTPVAVIGRMKIEQQDTPLVYSDGNSIVSSGYVMRGQKVEAWDKKEF